MISTHRIHPCSHLHALPNTFAGLMDLYERNYIAIRQLIPVIPPPEARRSSYVQANLALHLHILERSRYTSVLSLTYHFYRSHGLVLEPNVRIRVYHDARLVEVVASALRHRPPSTDPRVSELCTRWRINRFLYKWLRYCLQQGHRFDETVSDTVETPHRPRRRNP